MTVWLRRQEAQVHRDRLLAQGLADVVLASGGKSDNIQTAFKAFLDACFPFREARQERSDEYMKKMMEKHVKNGVITFAPAPTNFLKQKAKVMQVPDEWAERLRKKAASR